jgi:phosphodiesterase/alkaline phosphatase D-like protein
MTAIRSSAVAPRRRRGAKRPGLALLLAAALAAAGAGAAAQGKQGAVQYKGSGAAKDAAMDAAKGGSRQQGAARPLAAEEPAAFLSRRALSAVLGRPTDKSIALNLLSMGDMYAYVEYGADASSYGAKTEEIRLAAGVPKELEIRGLASDREYFYRLMSRADQKSAAAPGPSGRWRTARAAGSEFSFEIIGDSHPERREQFDARLYAQTLAAAAKDAPDFFMTIGDDFSVDTLQSVTESSVAEVYLRQRVYLSLVGEAAPIFLVNGNHEQAALANLDGSAADVAVWAQTRRNAFFPQPAPDGFYTGDAEKVQQIGLLRDYYAWTWGDALFVVIDPYWHSPEAVDNVFGGGEKTRDQWKTTLGDAQYAWLKKTLEGSKATFKFVFSHHVSGTGRGGIERAPYFEWGGKSADGRSDFAAQRPGWASPIQELFSKNKVTAFVQGHDHVFASQVLDGVAYITLPEPADPNYALYNADAFRSGDSLPNSGRVRFTVGPKRVIVEYLREWLPGTMPAGVSASESAYRLEIPAGGPPGRGSLGAGQAATKASGAAAAESTSAGGRLAGDKPAGEKSAGGGAKSEKAAKPEARATEAVPGSGPAQSAAPAPAGDLDGRTLVECPGATSVRLATAFGIGGEYYYKYGEDPSRLDRSTPARSAAAGAVARDVIEGLQPGKTYYYRLARAARGSKDFALSEEGRFATRKAPGEGFVFDIEADPHLDENSSGEVYRETLARMAADSPDFIVDLGDASMAEKLAKDAAGYVARNQLVRSYWDEIGNRSPFLMALGNHDGEHGWEDAQKGKPSSAEAAATRKAWLLDPSSAPEDTYSVFGDFAYGFEWGDALFVFLDPYLAEGAKPAEDGWAWTLGKAQYDWLSGLLARSKAAFRFVFIHNMLGGKGKDARGGADWADYYEWGGSNLDGKPDFASMRTGWAMPIRDLFVKYGIDVVFRGHDHFYAREEDAGIVYQLVPQPSLAKAKAMDEGELAEYGYSSGTFLPSPGYLRVSVAPERALVEYVRAGTGEVASSYSIPRGSPYE